MKNNDEISHEIYSEVYLFQALASTCENFKRPSTKWEVLKGFRLNIKAQLKILI